MSRYAVGDMVRAGRRPRVDVEMALARRLNRTRKMLAEALEALLAAKREIKELHAQLDEANAWRGPPKRRARGSSL